MKRKEKTLTHTQAVAQIGRARPLFSVSTMSLNGSPGLMQQTSSGGRSQPQQIRGSGTLTDHQRPQAANPFFFPERFLDSGLRLDGAVVQKFPVSDDPVTHLHNIMALPMREDDVVIAAYHKSGTHWMADILHMLTRGCVTYMEKSKEDVMFEYKDDLASLEDEPSPRIFNSHLYMRFMPRQMLQKRIKVIHLVRNPKDVAVSLYHHLKQYAQDQFNFDRFLQGYMMDHYLSISHQLNYLTQMAEFVSTHPHHPVKTIAYEDMKQDGLAVVRDVAQFLELPANEQLFQEIVTACSFEKLKTKDEARSMPANLQRTVPGNKSLKLFRKGVIGDWKNHFTVTQNETFEEFLRRRQTGCGKFLLYWD
ncbi:hypothetical protein RRG08_045556 [Elysia crispata]|uniref:Sulfotransferase domain-containing protein n=1 Tax=Elysia crispata TaxID=231223 RepID=A0AAE1ACD8_9GAST|nr:hypothetical protein RRG08_045556 [Elysia crispata]